MSVSVSTPLLTPLPWGRTSVRVLVLANVLGAALIATAWYWAAGSADARSAPLNLAVIAVVVAGATNGLWLVRGRRAIGARRRAWLADLRGEGTAPAVATESLVRPSDGLVRVLRVEGARRYHRADCPLIADRPVDAVTRDAATAAGRSGCGACGA